MNNSLQEGGRRAEERGQPRGLGGWAGGDRDRVDAGQRRGRGRPSASSSAPSAGLCEGNKGAG